MKSPRSLTRAVLAVGILAPFVMSGCATISRADAAGAPADTTAIAEAAASAAAPDEPRSDASSSRSRPAAAAAAAAAAAVQAAQHTKPFNEVVKGAEETKGLFNVWRKDDKVWLELPADAFDKMFFFKSAVNQGIGENRIFGGSMTYPIGVAQIVEFHKHGQSVQLIAKNVKYTAKAGTPEARAVAAGFSDS
ncbi:MAG TPA: DUF5118 domain-containing protein, partial [Casimicrobiaceae bacterium]|nr:DUF5118 domain-containing protein [Casimicrobiaceae bacterium]